MNNVKGLISSDAHPIAMIVQAALAKLQGEPSSVVYPVDKMAPIYRPFGWHGHVGVDWIIVPGTPVPSIKDGEVIESAAG